MPEKSQEPRYLKLIQAYESILYPLLAVLLGGFLIFFVIIPQYQGWQQTNLKLKQVQDRTKKLQEKLNQLRAIDKQQAQERLDLTLKILPVDKEVLPPIFIIQQFARETNLRINQISYTNQQTGNQPANSQKPQTYRIELSLTGELEDIRTFVNRLKESPKLLSVESIHISGSKLEVTYTADQSLGNFYQGIAQNPGKIDDPAPSFSEKDEELISKIKQLRDSFSLVSIEDVSSAARGKSDPFQ